MAGNTQADDILPSIGVRGGANCRITPGPDTQLSEVPDEKVVGLPSRSGPGRGQPPRASEWCQCGGGQLLSVTKVVEGGTCCQGESSYARGRGLWGGSDPSHPLMHHCPCLAHRPFVRPQGPLQALPSVPFGSLCSPDSFLPLIATAIQLGGTMRGLMVVEGD